MGQKGLHHLFCISQGRSGSREPGSFSFRHWRLLSYSLPLRWGSARPRPPYRGPWHPQAACGGLERAVLLPMALAAGHRRALRAAAAPACRWLPGSRLWAHPCGGERPERPPSRLSRRRQRLSLHEGWQCLGFPPPWRSPLWQRGVLLLPWRGIRLTPVMPLPQKGLPPYHFTGIIGRHPGSTTDRGGRSPGGGGGGVGQPGGG